MLSRVASSLYWMNRYVERAENTARVLDVAWRMSLLVKEPGLQAQEWSAPLAITGALDAFPGGAEAAGAREVLAYMALDPLNPSSIFSCARQARENARAVRGAITSEMWEVVNATWLELQQMDGRRLQSRGVTPFFDWVKERSHLFRGVTFGTLLRDEAYWFSRLGTHIERADSTARILDVKYHVLLPNIEAVGGAVDYYQWSAVLRSVSAFESYRKVYRDVITPLRLAELMILDEDMPRSLHFCLMQACDTLERVRNDRSDECLRQAGLLLSQLRYGRVADVFAAGLHEYLTAFLESTQRLSDEVDRAFFARPEGR